MAERGFALCLPFGREPHAAGLGGVLLRAAEREPASADQAQALRHWLDRVQALMGLDDQQALSYEDARRARRRLVQYRSPAQAEAEVKSRTLDGLLLAGDTQSQSWLRTLLQEELPAEALGCGLLAPVAQAPAHLAPRSPQVCACFNVSEQAIRDQLGRCATGTGSAEDRLADLQGALKCGTQCGSCLPTLRRLVAGSLQPA